MNNRSLIRCVGLIINDSVSLQTSLDPLKLR